MVWCGLEVDYDVQCYILLLVVIIVEMLDSVIVLVIYFVKVI